METHLGSIVFFDVHTLRNLCTNFRAFFTICGRLLLFSLTTWKDCTLEGQKRYLGFFVVVNFQNLVQFWPKIVENWDFETMM